MDGFWQSEKFFSDIKDILKKELEPKKKLTESNKELYEIINDTESVCITIRRGDYISNEKFKKIYYICDENYFYRGVNKIKELVKNPTLIVFSDDVEWAKENLDFGVKTYYETGKDDACEKIRLMSACKHFVISNSSFSWWAQYLSNNENKIVIAPKNWYTNGDNGDIYQDFWTLI